MTTMMMDEEAGGSPDHVDLFKEPDDYFEPEKPPTFTEYSLQDGQTLLLRLVGHNPLWGHLLWNGSQVVAQYLEENVNDLVIEKTVLELGAGAGLPSLVCAVHGAKTVVATDYPDPDLVENLRYNIRECKLIPSECTVVAEGFLWGNSVEAVKAHLDDTAAGFDILILADILFNHSEHEKLLESIKATLKQDLTARALVFFTPYRPWLFQKDLRFFDLAKAGGFEVNKILEKSMEKVMFEEDPGDELLRRTVFGYEIKWRFPFNSLCDTK